MKLLLDTHAFMWWDSNSSKLSAQAFALCQDRANLILLSVVSVWEMQIKLQAGKLRFSVPLADLIGNQRQANNVEVLPVTLTHVLALSAIPMHHKDPFDRLLIAQANIEGAVLVSNDAMFAQYPVQVLW